MLLQLLEIFLEVARTKNFSQAARNLGVSKSYVSKKIAALEDELDCELLLRNTRKVNLTSAGLGLFEDGQRALTLFADATEKLKKEKNDPSGVLKILVPHAFANSILANMLPEFQKIYPKITFYFQLGANIKDFINSGFDLAIRAQKPTDQDLISKKIMSAPLAICGTNTYFLKYGRPTQLEELSSHNVCSYSKSYAPEKSLLIKDKGVEKKIKVRGVVQADSMEFIKSQMLVGNCLAILSAFFIQKEVERGAVEVLFPDCMLSSSNLYAVYSKRKTIPLKIQVFLKSLEKYLASL